MSAAAASAIFRTSTMATPVFSACSFMRSCCDCWQGRRESNPQPAVLETAALPIELLPCRSALLQDLGHDAGADGAAALADREPEALFHGDRSDQLHHHLDVVPRHDHLHPGRQLDGPGHVGGAEVEL